MIWLLQTQNINKNGNVMKKLISLILLCLLTISLLTLTAFAEDLNFSGNASFPLSVVHCINECVITQQKENFCLPKVLFLFIQAAGLAYHHDAVVDIINGKLAAIVSHHAPACILPAA